MIVADIKDDAKYALGNCSDALLYRRLTEAVELLANSGSGMWDGMIGSMTICVDNVNGCITLPRDVQTPIQLNADGCPTFPRDKWFQYHLNGPGSTKHQFSGAFDVKGGDFATFREINTPQPIEVESETVADNGKTIIIAYYDEDDREQQEELTLNIASYPVTTGNVKSIRWVRKAVTERPVKLNTTLAVPYVLAWYYPDEVNPLYTRIKVNARRSVEMIYRRKNVKIASDLDYIPLRNKLAVIQALRAVRYRYEENIAKALDAESDAIRLLDQEQNSRNVNNSPVGPQIQNLSTAWEGSLWNDNGWNTTFR